ncbi:MAG TPA: glutaminyl-peptide cyclotransferase [Fimbriimonadaceae bacterium]|nr:glutaminyl-peptide cyclotransferase [Fimbriimonadaceae bacterium]
MIQTLLSLALCAAAPKALLTPDQPMAVPGGAAHFDFMNIDPTNRLVFAEHPGKSQVVVVNLDTKSITNVDLEAECNGIGIDAAGKRAFAAGPGKTLVRIDLTTLKKTGSLALDGPGDCVQYDAKRGVVYVDNDDGTNLWVVDPDTMKLKGAVTIKEAPEYMEIDQSNNRIFQAIKSTSSVQVIDPDSLTVLAEWGLGDLTSPHGLALDRKAGLVFVAGKNGKLDILSMKTGKILNTVNIVNGSDQIAYDAGLKRVYIPGESKIQIVQISGDKGAVAGDVPVGKDCHRVAIDPKTHDVWVAYQDGTDSFVQRFAAG